MTKIMVPYIFALAIPFFSLHAAQQQNWHHWKSLSHKEGIKKVDLLDSDTALIYPYGTNDASLITFDKTIAIDHTNGWWKPLVHPKTNLILSNDTKTSAALWNFKGEKIHTYTTKQLMSVDFNKDGTSFAALINPSYTESLITIRTIEGAIAMVYSVPNISFTSLYIHPCDENLLYALDSCSESLYWLDRRAATLSRLTTDSIKKVSFNAHNMLIGAVCAGLARIYDHRTGKGINLVDFHEPLTAVFNSTGSHLLTREYGASFPGTRVWDASTIHQAKCSHVDAYDNNYVTTLKHAERGHFSPGGNSVVAHYYDGYTTQPNPQNTVDVYTLEGMKLSSFTQKKRIIDAYFDRLGDNIIVHEPERSVSIWKRDPAWSKSTSDQPVLEVQA